MMDSMDAEIIIDDSLDNAIVNDGIIQDSIVDEGTISDSIDAEEVKLISLVYSGIENDNIIDVRIYFEFGGTWNVQFWRY